MPHYPLQLGLHKTCWEEGQTGRCCTPLERDVTVMTLTSDKLTIILLVQEERTSLKKPIQFSVCIVQRLATPQTEGLAPRSSAQNKRSVHQSSFPSVYKKQTSEEPGRTCRP